VYILRNNIETPSCKNSTWYPFYNAAMVAISSAGQAHSGKPGNSVSAALTRQGIENLVLKKCDGRSTPDYKSVSLFTGN
jgi:hypothetical protein